MLFGMDTAMAWSKAVLFQLLFFSFSFSYYGDFSVSVPVSVVYVRIAIFDSQIKLIVKLIVHFQKRSVG